MQSKPVESKVNTVVVPALGGDPVTLYSAAERVLRVVVRNAGGNTLFIAHDTSSLQQVQLAGTYQLPAGQSDTFVLQPRQTLVAAAAGPNGLASIAVSEAIPMTWSEA